MTLRNVIALSGGLLCEPKLGSEPQACDLFIENGRIVDAPKDQSMIAANYDVSDCYIMSGGIDIHTHIGGGKTNLARLLCRNYAAKKEDESSWQRPLSAPVPSTVEAGRRYLEMGYTSCIEPAVLPGNARQAHLEMGDTPWLNTGGFLVLGNEEVLLSMLGDGVGDDELCSYVAWMLFAHQCIGVKVVNPTGISAAKVNVREAGLDDPHPVYGVTGRTVLFRLAKAIDQLNLPHPLHVHCNHLGRAGNIETTLETISAVQGHRIHITHAQFHAYTDDGPNGYGSGASQLARAVNQHGNVTIDVGQVLFQRTVTLSADVMHQFANREFAQPKQLILQDFEAQAGCGVLPFRYRHKNYVNALQWAVGLELFLQVDDPSRVFLTTDHPNGAPFTSYPHLMRLLGDREFRNECFDRLHPDAQSASQLASLQREYSLMDLVKMTRSGPAKSLGLKDRGSLSVGNVADIAVYSNNSRLDAMMAEPVMVFKSGQLVFRDGEFIAPTAKETYVSASAGKLELHEFAESKSMQERWFDAYGHMMQTSAISVDEFESACNSTLQFV